MDAKRWLTKVMISTLLCLMVVSSCLAEGSVKLIGIHDFSEYGYLALRAGVYSANGAGVASAAESYQVAVDGFQTYVLDEVNGNKIDTTGYLFVVDTSKLYANRVENANKCIQEVMTSLLNLVKDKDRVRFLWAGSSVEISNYMDRVSALATVTGDECELMTRRRSAKDEDSAALYDAIGQAVALSLSPDADDDCVYHQIVVISDCMDSPNGVTSTSLESIRASIAASGPLPIWCVALRNSGVGADKAANADKADIVMRSFVSATSGSFFTMDYGTDALRESSAEKQAKAISTNIASQIAGWANLIVDLRPSLGMLNRQAHESEVVLSYNGQIERVKRTFAFSLLPTPEPSLAPTPAPTATPNPYFVQAADKNSDHVRELQTLLSEKGYYKGAIDGTFNVATRRAYQMLCDANGLKVSADENDNLVILMSEWQLIAGDSTLTTAVPVTPVPTATPTPTPTPTATPTYIELHWGDADSGEESYVAVMQVRLKVLGYYGDDNFTPGVYDEATMRALVRFCETMGLNTTGDGEIATLNVQQILHSSNAIRFETPTPEPEATPTPRPEFIELHQGDADSGEDSYVAAMQVRLKELGYYGGDSFTPGVYDEGTARALVRFCQAMGINTTEAGNVATLNIQQILHSSNAIAYATPTPEPVATATPMPEYMDISKGDQDTEESSYVANMQIRLKSLGYYLDEEVNLGDYDDATVAALARYCEQAGFRNLSDGSKATVGILKQLFSDEAKAYTAPKVSARDAVVNWLTDTVSVAGCAIPTWIFVAVGAVAILLIIVLIIMACVRSNGGHVSETGGVKPLTDTGLGRTDLHFSKGSKIGSDDETAAETNLGRDYETVGADMSGGYGIAVTLDIEYNGMHSIERYEVVDTLTIGRGSDCDIKLDPQDGGASRMHAELIRVGSHLRVRSITTRERGTTVNGRKIGEAVMYSTPYDLPTSESSVPDASNNAMDLESGDVIGISAHRITVKF